MELTMGADLYTTANFGHNGGAYDTNLRKIINKKKDEAVSYWTVRSKNKKWNIIIHQTTKDETTRSLLPQCNECTFANGVGGICGKQQIVAVLQGSP